MDTKMTKHLKLPKPLAVNPKEASDAISKGFSKKKNVIYVLKKWFVFMTIIKSIPEFIFKKLNL
jgi:hypothetical protein